MQLVELWLQFRFAFLIFLKNFLQFWPAVSLGGVRQRSWQRDSALTLINWRLWPCPNLMMRERGVDEGEWEQFQFVNTKKKNKIKRIFTAFIGAASFGRLIGLFSARQSVGLIVSYIVYIRLNSLASYWCILAYILCIFLGDIFQWFSVGWNSYFTSFALFKVDWLIARWVHLSMISFKISKN